MLSRAWAAGWWPEPTLEPSALEGEACRREGAEAVPGVAWREPFRLLADELSGQARLSPLGRQIANGQLVTLLRMRIRAERLLKRNPEVLERPIKRPVIILGHMRSGTTRLHRLLAQDPQFAHTRHFESLEPVPHRGRRLRAAAVQALLEQANPDVAAVHPTGPLEPEEEWGLHSFSWHGSQAVAQWRVPGFAQHLRTRDLLVPYREFAALLRIIGSSRGEAPDKPWLLKSPQFMGDLPAVLRQFPDARLLCLHRDPVAVVGSSASLVWHQRRVHSERIDKAEVGRECLELTGFRERASREARTRHRGVPQIDVEYEEVSADWQGAVRRIYEFLNLPLGEAVLDRMRRFMDRPARHAGHRYRLEEFDVSAEAVRDAMTVGERHDGRGGLFLLSDQAPGDERKGEDIGKDALNALPPVPPRTAVGR